MTLADQIEHAFGRLIDPTCPRETLPHPTAADPGPDPLCLCGIHDLWRLVERQRDELSAEMLKWSQTARDNRTQAEWLRESIGECHVMISRLATDFQGRPDWETTSLPYRVRTLMRKILTLTNMLAEVRYEISLECSHKQRAHGGCSTCDRLSDIDKALNA